MPASPEPAAVTTDLDVDLDAEPIWADSDVDEPSGNGAGHRVSATTAQLEARPGNGRLAAIDQVVPAEAPTSPDRPRGRIGPQTTPPAYSPDGLASGEAVRLTRRDQRRLTKLGEQAAKAKQADRAPRRGRRVKRIVRRVDLWSVLKLALVLYTCLYSAALLAVAGLWAFLNSAGLVDRFESFMKDVGFDKFQFRGSEMFRGVVAGGAVLVLAGAVLTVIGFALLNVVSELTGGLRLTVIEEEPVLAHNEHAG